MHLETFAEWPTGVRDPYSQLVYLERQLRYLWRIDLFLVGKRLIPKHESTVIPQSQETLLL